MNSPLVSIISPCYNGARYLPQFFDSILSQTHKNLEFFFINDGSTDETEKIACEYEEKFATRGIRYEHFHKKNCGASAAINLALPKIRGEFFMWPDSDDILLPNNVEKKVAALEGEGADLAICKARIDRADSSSVEILETKKPVENEILFGNYIFEKNVIFCPIVFLARTAKFRENCPSMRIFESRGGQNWQILLPILVDGKVLLIDEILCNYRIHGENHSLSAKTDEQKIERYRQHKEILLQTLIPLHRKIKYLDFNILLNLKYETRLNQNALSQKNAEIMQKDNVLVAKDTEIQHKNTEIAAIQAELQSIKSSFSYRIGRKVTWLPRKVRGTFRWLKTRGLVATIRHAGGYVLRKLGVKK